MSNVAFLFKWVLGSSRGLFWPRWKLLRRSGGMTTGIGSCPCVVSSACGAGEKWGYSSTAGWAGSFFSTILNAGKISCSAASRKASSRGWFNSFCNVCCAAALGTHKTMVGPHMPSGKTFSSQLLSRMDSAGFWCNNASASDQTPRACSRGSVVVSATDSPFSTDFFQVCNCLFVLSFPQVIHR